MDCFVASLLAMTADAIGDPTIRVAFVRDGIE
jgi:hypothetical protein